MCGIVGAAAQRDIAEILLEGLKRLEYRGYDSAGMAFINPQTKEVERLRVLGKVSSLEAALKENPINGHTGIAHTRWATHGQPNQVNAHPHFSQREVAVVHNGIIENHEKLRKKLIDEGYKFESETDTEVVAHLIHFYYQQEKHVCRTIRKAITDLRGAYALGIINTNEPYRIYAARRGSPLVLGLGIGENFISSDPLALMPVTQKFIYLEDGDIAQLKYHDIVILNEKDERVERKIYVSSSSTSVASKGKYRHFMLKEIFDQPDSINETINEHIINKSFMPETFGHQAKEIFKQTKRILIVACGTSYHAGLVGRYWLESIAGIPCQVEIASENRYRQSVVEPGTLFIALSQSGETADTLAALRQAKKAGFLATLGICNVPQSSLVRESNLVFLTRAGTEIGVAATKTFTAQLVALLLLAIAIGQVNKKLKAKDIDKIIKNISLLPGLMQETLHLDKKIKQLSKKFIDKENAIFLGRGDQHPIAMEGALKLKEISYMHAEAYPAGELKHGPLALVDEDMPVIVTAPANQLIDKLQSNVQEVLARGGLLYIFSDKSVNWQNNNGMTLVELPNTPELIAPIIYTIPLQLLSYHIAVLKGTDVDQPRNLAKSVTVE